MKLGKFLLSISLAVVLSGCAVLGGGFANKSSSISSYAGGSGNGWPWGGESKSSSGPISPFDPPSSGGPSSSSMPSSYPDAPVVYSVQINAPKTILGINESVYFSAYVQTSEGSDGSPYEVNWTSSNNNVATVNYYGEVIGKAIGTTVIRAQSIYDSSKYDTVTVTVNQNEMVIVGVDDFDLDTTYKLGSLRDDGYSFDYYYANGEITNLNGSSLAISRNWNSAVDLKIEGNKDHYHLALLIDGQKKYINSVSDIDYHISLDSTPVNDWSWDNKYYTFTTVVNGVKYLMQRNGNYYDECYFYMVNYDSASYSYVSRLLVQTEKKEPESINIVEENVRVLVDSGLYLHAKISPIGASLTRLKWTVSNNEYVSVSSQGYVRVDINAKRGTTATIKASCGSIESNPCTILIYSYGTINDPLTVDETCDLIDQETESKYVYVSGTVTSNTSYDYSRMSQIVLANNSGSVSYKLFANSVYLSNGYDSIYTEANSLVGKKVVLYGRAYYSEDNKYSLDYPDLCSVTN